MKISLKYQTPLHFLSILKLKMKVNKSVVNILKSRECLRLYIKGKHSLNTSNHLSRHCKLKRCKKVDMDAEMLYHKDAVFWLTNFKRVHSPPPHPLETFFIKRLYEGSSHWMKKQI